MRFLITLTTLAATLMAAPARADTASYNYAEHHGYNLWGNYFYISQCDYAQFGQPGQPCGPGYRVAETYGAHASSLPNYGHNEGIATTTMPAGGDYDWHWGTTHVNSWWSDTFVVESSTLAPGTLVTLDLRVDWAYSISLTAGADSLTRAEASLHFSGPDCCNLVTLVQGNKYDTADPGTSLTGSLLTHVGDTFTLVGVLRLDAGVTGGTVGGTAWSQGSADYFITPQAGVSLSTGSGHDYSFGAPVPEPQSWALMGLGLLGVSAVARRRATQA